MQADTKGCIDFFAVIPTKVGIQQVLSHTCAADQFDLIRYASIQ
jgi:hypothetical protein